MFSILVNLNINKRKVKQNKTVLENYDIVKYEKNNKLKLTFLDSSDKDFHASATFLINSYKINNKINYLKL